MIIERDGVKFYAPDSATTLIDGAWTIDDSQLVLWGVYQNDLNRDRLIAEKTRIENDLFNIIYADINVQSKALTDAVEQYNEPLIADLVRGQERITEINKVIQ